MQLKRGESSIAKVDKTRVNEDITAPKVRVVGPDGEMIGVLSVQDAINKAYDAGLDLVEVSPNAEPPVCKILDYGKYKYMQQKKANEAKKKQKVVEVKEIKIRPNIDTHDLEVKMRSVHKFLDNGDKVKVTLRFRGREMAHKELGMDVLNGIREELGDKIKVENEPKFEGRQVIMVIAPAK